MFAERSQATRPLHFTSAKNPLLKEIRRAIDRGSLTDSGLCVAESLHLLEEAIRSDCEIPYVIGAESVYSALERRVQGLTAVQTIRVPDAVFATVSSTETSQGVMALVRPPSWTIDALFRAQSLVVVLDGIQDPGNAGAIVRAAEAFGATGVMFVKGTVNPYNPKTLRAAAGSLFRVPVAAAIDDKLAVAALTQHRLDVYSAMPRADQAAGDVNFRRRCAIVLGSEGRGVGPALSSISLDVRIPTRRVESLNVAVAAGVLLYEAWRQRQLPDEPV